MKTKLIAAGLFLLTTITSYATWITYKYTGVVTSVEKEGDWSELRPFHVGDAIIGTVRVDTNNRQLVDGWTRFWSPIESYLSIEGSDGGTSMGGYGGEYFAVLNDPAQGNFGFAWENLYQGTGFHSQDAAAYFNLSTHVENGVMPPLADFDTNEFNAFEIDYGGIFGPITREDATGKILTLTSHVPESGSTVALLAIALGLVGGWELLIALLARQQERVARR